MGFSIGLLFLVFFLKKKSGEGGLDFCYMPNCRVLKDIRSKQFVVDKGEKVDFGELDSLLQQTLHDGNVDFKQSDTKTSPCKTYVINTVKANGISLKVKNCLDVAYVTEIGSE